VAQSGNESLAGEEGRHHAKKLLDFKTGRKPATIMHQLSKGYSDEQISAIAAYFPRFEK
jgi:sulfide dehydrogenase cytochrome subunit